MRKPILQVKNMTSKLQ